MKRIAGTLLLAVWLVACTHEATAPDDPGFVRNAEFARDERGRLTGWTFVTHATRGSYRFDVDGEELRIERVGPEPWGQAVQSLDAGDLAGKTLTFRAEIALSEPAERSGLGVRVLGFEAGVPRALGESILMAERTEAAEIDGWQVHRLDFTVPQGATRVELALRHAGDGTMRVRRPSLLAR